MLLGLALCSAREACAQLEAGPDTLRARFEVGGSTDVTNEQYYEATDNFIDTTFVSLNRRLVSSPESRFAGVFSTALEGTRGGYRVHYQLLNDLSAGNRVVDDALALAWKLEPDPGWRLQLAPRFEYRHDRTFGRDLEELRGSFNARMRNRLAAEESFLEWGASGDFLHTHGQGSAFFLDRNSAEISAAFERSPLSGDEWRLGYSLTGRVFPDSSERNHLEHGWVGRWARVFEGGHSVALETEGERRRTLNPAPTSRDKFWDARGTLEATARFSDLWSLGARLEVESQRYDVEDSSLFFNYQAFRARLGPRLDRAAEWSVRLGPCGELLRSPINPIEQYREGGGFAELEYLGHGSYWSISPEAGWRAYDQGSPSQFSNPEPGIHSSFAYVELELIGDQPLPGGLRLRTLTSLRLESHTNSVDDARSLYFSCDLRKLF